MRDKYEKEIEEILENLEKTDHFMPQKPPRRRPSGPSWLQSLRQNVKTMKIQLSPGWLMVAALVLIVISIFVRPVAPGIASPLGLLGVLLFVAAYIYSFRGQRNYRIQKRWRGRIIELPRRNSWRYRLSRWWRSRR